MLKRLLKEQDPFKGSHWPPQPVWGAETQKKFPLLQKTDLIEYLYEHQSAQNVRTLQAGLPISAPCIVYFSVSARRNCRLKCLCSLRGSDRIAVCTTVERPDEDEGTRTTRAAARDRADAAARRVGGGAEGGEEVGLLQPGLRARHARRGEEVLGNCWARPCEHGAASGPGKGGVPAGSEGIA